MQPDPRKWGTRRTTGAVGFQAGTRTVDGGFGRLPRAAVVDDLQAGLEDFQEVGEVVDVAFVVVRRVYRRIFFRELGLVEAVGQRVTDREVGGPRLGGAGARREYERAERAGGNDTACEHASSHARK